MADNGSQGDTSDSRMLHDAGWKKIQQNTFTRWVNQNLMLEGTQIHDLQTDLSDGVNLIRLVQVLAQRIVAQRYNKKPSMRQQKLDNVQQALNFIQNDEGLKLVSIDGTHIVDGNLKLILGLIWTLILHYSIGKNIDGEQQQKKGQTPKQRLMAWIRSKLPSDVPVTNFTSDWNDGLALGALVDALAPGACPDWRSWRPDEALENTRKAMKAAEDSLGIGSLIAPEELINPNVDEKSVMTFLSQFPRAKAPPKGRITGVDAEPVVGRETHFVVEVERENMEPSVEIVDSEGRSLPVNIRQAEGSSTVFHVSYQPERIGKHELTVHGVADQIKIRLGNFSIRAIPAPYLVDFKDHIEVGESQKFRVANLTEKNRAEVLILDPRGNQHQIPPQQQVGASVAFIHRPEAVGLYAVNVFVDKRHIPGSPFALHATPTAAASALVWGRGLSRKGPRVGDRLPVHIDNCSKSVQVEVRNKDGLVVHCTQVTDGENKTFEYAPLGTGPHVISVTCNDQHIGLSPYEVDVSPKTTSAVRAVGPGLEAGVAGEPVAFHVDTRGDASVLEFSTEGPSEADIRSVDHLDNTARVHFSPAKSGVYKVNVINNGEHIKDSPFVIKVEPETETKAAASARLLPIDTENLKVGEAFEFEIQSAAEPRVKVYDTNFNEVQDLLKVYPQRSHAADLHTYRFTPKQSGRYVLCPSVDKVAVPNTPVAVEVARPADLTKLHVYGAGVGSNVRAGSPVSFNVDTKDVECRDLQIEITGVNGEAVNAEIIQESSDKPFLVTYTPVKAGCHRAKVFVDGVVAYDVAVDVYEARSRKISTASSATTGTATSATASERGIPSRRLSQTRGASQDREDSGAQNKAQEASLYLMLKDVDPKHLTARVKNPDGKIQSVPVVHSGNNNYVIHFDSKPEGIHVIDVFHQGQRVQGSPFRMPVTAVGRTRAHLVRAEGTGLQYGKVGERQSFAILVGDAGGGELKASINGPSKADITLTDYRDGVCRAEYVTDEPGLYTITLSLDDQDVHGSPFKVFISPQSSNSSPPPKRAFSPTASSQNSFDRLEESIRSQHSGNVLEVTDLNEGAPQNVQVSTTPLREITQNNATISHQSASYANAQRHEYAEKYQVVNSREETYKRLLKQSIDYDEEHRRPFLTSTAEDVRRVTVEGSGLYEFNPGKAASFTINTSKAGRSYLFVGVATGKGPADDVDVKHVGGGEYSVSYTIPDRTRALVIVKYGDREILGSPFTVRPA